VYVCVWGGGPDVISLNIPTQPLCLFVFVTDSERVNCVVPVKLSSDPEVLCKSVAFRHSAYALVDQGTCLQCICFFLSTSNMKSSDLILLVFFSGATAQRGPGPPHSRGFRDHTQLHTTVGRTPLEEGSACRRDNTRHSQVTDIHAPRGIQTRNPSKLAVVDLRLRPLVHWDRQFY
jgi:hypothetical protein